MSDGTDEKRTYPHGVPCWIEVEQADAGAGREFYRTLFGWDFAQVGPSGAGYSIARLDGKDVGGLQEGDSGSGWVSYVACDDIDATCTLIQSSGGTVLVAPSRAEPGASATCADPQGAVFRLWQGGTNPGAQVVNEPGAWNFSDLQTPAADAAPRLLR